MSAVVNEADEDAACDAQGCDPKEDLHREHAFGCSGRRPAIAQAIADAREAENRACVEVVRKIILGMRGGPKLLVAREIRDAIARRGQP